MIDDFNVESSKKFSQLQDASAKTQLVSEKHTDALDNHSEEGYCNVETAARILGKSVRQTQRLLSQNQLKGRRRPGRRGMEWQVESASLVSPPKGRFNAFQRSIMNRLSALEYRLEEIMASLHVLEQKIDGAN